jgi:hypothetical protein
VIVAVLEPPKPPYDAGVTVSKGVNSAVISALLMALVGALVALLSDATFIALITEKLPPWATPLFTFGATAFINWWKNKNNPEVQRVTPPLAR